MNREDNFIELYVKWLKDNMKSKILNTELGQYTEISTPFLDRHNDHIQIYIKRQDDGTYFLTDGGYTINDLSMSGCDVMSSPKRKSILTTITNGFGTKINGEELCVSTSYASFAQKKHALIQTMLSVNDMFVLSRSQVQNVFYEDVQAFFDLHRIPYIPNAQYSGTSGFSHFFEFSIPAIGKKPEQFVRTINEVNSDKIGTTLFAWNDIKDSRRPGAQLYVILNDTERKVKAEHTNALEVYGVHPALWSERDELVSKLSA